MPGPKGPLQFTNPGLLYLVQVKVNLPVLLTNLSPPALIPYWESWMNSQKSVAWKTLTRLFTHFFAKRLRSKMAITYNHLKEFTFSLYFSLFLSTEQYSVFIKGYQGICTKAYLCSTAASTPSSFEFRVSRIYANWLQALKQFCSSAVTKQQANLPNLQMWTLCRLFSFFFNQTHETDELYEYSY